MHAIATLSMTMIASLDYLPPPDRFGLPAPPWVFLLLMGITLGLHFLCMNATLAGAAVAVALDVLNLAGGQHHRSVRTLYGAMPVLLSLTITTGVAPLLFVQVLYGPLFYPATILMGWTWLALVPVLIVGFYLLKVVAYRLSNAALGLAGRWDTRPAPRLALGILVLACFVAAAWILTQSHMLAAQPEHWPHDGQWKQTRLIVTPALSLPRFGHNLGGALAVGGVVIAAMGWWRRWRGLDDAHDSRRLIRTGLTASLLAMIAAVVLGPLMLAGLPGAVRGPLLRPGLLSGLWWLGLAAVLGQLVLLAVCLRFPDRPGPFVALCAAVLVGLSGMIAAREQVRLAFLGRPEIGFGLDLWPVRPQVSSLAAFVLGFVLMLGVCAWLVRTAMTARPTPAEAH